jgi:hypothetical protein
MELQLANKLQHEIASMMWEAKNQEVVNKIIKLYGHDALVVYHMMIAATFDQINDTDIAQEVLLDIARR